MRKFDFDIDAGVGSLLPEKGVMVDFGSFRQAVEEAGFELLWMEAEVRGRLEPPAGAEDRPVLKVEESGQRLLLFEGRTDEEHRAFGLLIEWMDAPDREVAVRGRVHPHAGGLPSLTVKTFRVLPDSPPRSR